MVKKVRKVRKVKRRVKHEPGHAQADDGKPGDNNGDGPIEAIIVQMPDEMIDPSDPDFDLAFDPEEIRDIPEDPEVDGK